MVCRPAAGLFSARHTISGASRSSSVRDGSTDGPPMSLRSPDCPAGGLSLPVTYRRAGRGPPRQVGRLPPSSAHPSRADSYGPRLGATAHTTSVHLSAIPVPIPRGRDSAGMDGTGNGHVECRLSPFCYILFTLTYLAVSRNSFSVIR